MRTPTTLSPAPAGADGRSIEGRVRALRLASRTVAALVVLGGSLVLVGWQLGTRALQAVGPADVVMNPLSALLFVLVGSVLLIGDPERSGGWSSVASVTVALCGALVLIRPIAGLHVGVDDLLFREQVRSVSPPDWMADNAALSFLLLGLALMARRARRRRWGSPVHWLVLPVALMSLLVVIGYLYGAVGFITFQRQLPMALNTALFFLAACFALVTARPDQGVAALFVSDGAGGQLTRRLLPALLIVPLATGWFVHLGLHTGVYGPTVGLALLTLATIVLSVLLTVLTAGALHRSDLALLYAKETAERAREEAEHARLEAERANRAKSAFLSGMSHELRTPLNSILGFAQLLQAHVLDAVQKHYVERICAAGDHLLKLINEVLDLARIESDRLTLSVEPVHVVRILRETLDLARPLTGQYRVLLSEEIPPEADCYVSADHQRITQVMLNLVCNAIKYNRPGGGVRFLCRVEDGTNGSPHMAIGVWDSGPGIPPERMAELFTPFARLGAESSGIEGTGLGLSLAKRYAEAMSGSIRVESVPNVGSTFWVELPLTRSPSEHAQESAPGSDSLGKEFSLQGLATILYIEENLANLDLVESIIASFPSVRLIPALQGRLGLELAREHRPDLILLDLHLPDMTGEAVLQKLREDSRTRSIPVVIISADATPSRIQRLLGSGARQYLTKPINVQEFLETVERLASERSGGSDVLRESEAEPDLVVH
jgi:signal transduction histidine kinase/CheY-like chemotaxis protein